MDLITEQYERLNSLEEVERHLSYKSENPISLCLGFSIANGLARLRHPAVPVKTYVIPLVKLFSATYTVVYLQVVERMLHVSLLLNGQVENTDMAKEEEEEDQILTEGKLLCYKLTRSKSEELFLLWTKREDMPPTVIFVKSRSLRHILFNKYVFILYTIVSYCLCYMWYMYYA